MANETSNKAANVAKKSNARRVGTRPTGFTDEERAAMKERARELKAEARAGKSKADPERAVLAKIAQMPQPDRTLGAGLQAIVRAIGPGLSPKLW